PAGVAADPSRAPGLARVRVHRFGLGCETLPQANCPVRHLSTDVAGAPGAPRTRPWQYLAGAWARAAADRRDAPRPGARRQRAAGRAAGWAERQAVPARGALGGRHGCPEVRSGPRPGPVPARALHLLEAYGRAPRAGRLRRGRPERLRRTPAEHEHT